MYPPYLIGKQIKSFLNNKLSENDTPKENSNKESTTYHKLSYIGDISVRTKRKIGELCKRFCKKTDINIVWTPFKIGSLFSAKDRLSNALRSFAVYKFTYTGCQYCYIGETRHHLVTQIKEHLVTDKNSHIMKHLLENKTCKNLCDKSCFQVIDYASSPSSLKGKEALHIKWLKPVFIMRRFKKTFSVKMWNVSRKYSLYKYFILY